MIRKHITQQQKYFSAAMLLAFWPRSVFVGGRPVHCGPLSCIPGLDSLVASISPSPSCDDQNCPPRAQVTPGWEPVSSAMNSAELLNEFVFIKSLIFAFNFCICAEECYGCVNRIQLFSPPNNADRLVDLCFCCTNCLPQRCLPWVGKYCSQLRVQNSILVLEPS